MKNQVALTQLTPLESFETFEKELGPLEAEEQDGHRVDPEHLSWNEPRDEHHAGQGGKP